MKTHRVLALFSDFHHAFDAVTEIRRSRVPGISIDDVTLNSPIEHPEVEEVLGERPVHIGKLAFAGAAFGLIFGFIFIAAAQAGFLVQPAGGKAVIPLPSNLVLVYEMLIFFGVWVTFFGFLVLSGLLKESLLGLFGVKRGLYSEATSVDQIGVIVELAQAQLEPLKALFTEHRALEIKEEEI